MAVGNSALGQVVGGKFQGHAVACEYADTILSKLACQVRQHHSLLVELYAEFTVRQFFYNYTGYFY